MRERARLPQPQVGQYELRVPVQGDPDRSRVRQPRVCLLEAHPLAEEIRNQVVVKRGPLVYCLESMDIANGEKIDNILIPADIKLIPKKTTIEGSSIVALEGKARLASSESWEGVLYRLDAQMEGIPLWDRDISRYIYSNRVPVFNPLEDFLYRLPGWDGKDRIRELAATVPCRNPYWTDLFHRWFLNMVSHWRGYDKKYANSVSPLLVGAQGTRKSTFCRSIMPPSERSYYTDSIDFSRKKDAELYLNRFALINIDEFDQVSSTQQGFLKHILQKPVVNMRKPHASAVLEMRRYASFIATSNQKDLLTDPSGSRRFICIEVTGVIDTNRPIDYEQLYAQAMYELEHGERYWFDQEDEKIMMENNREFEQVPPEEQLFFRYFRAAQTSQV